jgi:hypothetical protein
MRKLLAIGLWLSLAASAGAEEYRNDAGHWRVEIPKNWVRFDAAKRAEVKRNAADPNVVFHDGFERIVGRPGFEVPPFLLIFEVKGNHRFLTYDLLEEALRREVQKLALEPGTKLGKVSLDRKNHRMTAELEVQAPAGKMQGIAYGFIGRDSIVLIQCFAPERDFPVQKGAFDGLADSFRYDDGFQFEPMSASKIGWICAGIGVGVIVVLAVAVGGILLLLKLMGKKQPSEPEA